MKINLPGKKQVYRLLKSNGEFYGGDVVALADENEEDFQIMHHPSEPIQSLRLEKFEKKFLLSKVVESGERGTSPKELSEIAEFSRKQLRKLPEEFKRFENPHIYKIGLSDSLKNVRDQLVDQMKEKSI